MPATSSVRSRKAAAASLATTAITLGALVIGCGSPVPSTGPATVGTIDAPREINVIMRDYLFEPNPLVLFGGETVRFNVINGGLLAHEFVLGDARVQAAWASAEAAATPPGFTATPPPVSLPPESAGLRIFLESGESGTALYRVPVDGALALACHIPGHVAQGMTGVIELRQADGP